MYYIIFYFEYQPLEVCSVEGALKSAQFIEDDPEAPDVALVIVRLALADFGRQVVRGADCCSFRDNHLFFFVQERATCM